MSVPQPSPSGMASTSSKPITPSRPMPISLDITSNGGPPAASSSLSNSPGRADRDREHRERDRGRRGSRTGGVSGGKLQGQSPGNDSNWRERVVPGSGGIISAGSSGSVGRTKGPERTVGGFAKRDTPSAPSASNASSSGTQVPNGTSSGDAKKDRDKGGADKAASLAHVPCRFYKAGSCTAGDSCPFSHEGSSKREVCQWFLKGNCKFGHKCALAHIRPGETMAMDRKNKKAQQLEGKADKSSASAQSPNPADLTPRDDPAPAPSAASAPVRSALSSSLQSPPVSVSASSASKLSSSPMREPYGPPAVAGVGSSSPSAGFLGRSPGAFGASPSRPSPLSSSFSARLAGPTSLALKGNPTTAATAIHPRTSIPSVPATAGPTAGFSSSFSHTTIPPEQARPPLSASMADGSYLRRSIWAHSATPDEPLSPRRPVAPHISQSRPDVFHDDDDDDHGEDLLPSSLSDLLTPIERARRMSRRDSNDYFGASPSRMQSSPSYGAAWSGERLAQSAGAAMGPVSPMQSIWALGPSDTRRITSSGSPAGSDFAFGPSTAAPPSAAPRQSLLSQQRAPVSPLRYTSRVRQSTGDPDVNANGNSDTRWTDARAAAPGGDADVDFTANLVPPYFNRTTDPSSPSAKALSAHAPGQSLPGGIAAALSRLHLQPDITHRDHPGSTGVQGETNNKVSSAQGGVMDNTGYLARRDDREEEMFAMDG